jgi:hypothetical protein
MADFHGILAKPHGGTTTGRPLMAKPTVKKRRKRANREMLFSALSFK